MPPPDLASILAATLRMARSRAVSSSSSLIDASLTPVPPAPLLCVSSKSRAFCFIRQSPAT